MIDPYEIYNAILKLHFSHRKAAEAVAQAARAEALEEAATACDARVYTIEQKQACNPNGVTSYAEGAKHEAMYCAIDIRALAKGAGDGR